MSQLLDDLLIDRTDFDDYRDMSKNVPDERINSFIREAQLREVRTFLGDTLYLKLLLDYDESLKTFTSQIYTDLWYGVDYTYNGNTIRFNGLIGYHIMNAYRRILDHQQLTVTRYGIKSMTTEFSEDIIQAKINKEKIDSGSMAKVYSSDADKFLRTNIADYPEWEYNGTTPIKNTAFNFIKI